MYLCPRSIFFTMSGNGEVKVDNKSVLKILFDTYLGDGDYNK